MSTAIAPELLLHETAAAAGAAGAVRPDGLVPLHIIRPGIGKGRGRHLYEADMLEREVNAGRFKSWKMYVDHQSPEAKRASQGLPRSIRDLAGVIKEAWWDPSVPADPQAGHAQGAVVGLAKVNRFMRSLIEDIPEAIGTSISAQATGVKPRMIGGQQVWLVEGIQPRGTVDFVTEAGAGGKVAALVECALEESWASEDDELMALIEANDLLELLHESHPEVLTELLETKKSRASKKKDDEDDPEEKPGDMYETNKEASEVTDIKELLAEALKTDEGKAEIGEILAPLVEAKFNEIVAPRLAELIETVIAEERELMQAESGAGAKRVIEVRDLRDAAHEMIAESKLPASMQAELKAKYDIAEDHKPTPALDVTEAEVEGEKKSALEQLRESVEADIAAKRAQVAEIHPTQVRGQGPAKQLTEAEKKEVEEGKKDEPKSTGSTLTDHLLTEARIDPSEDLWADL